MQSKGRKRAMKSLGWKRNQINACKIRWAAYLTGKGGRLSAVSEMWKIYTLDAELS